MSNGTILLIIAIFLALTIGSFVWYVATWDATRAEGHPHHLARNTPAGGIPT